MGGRFFFFAFLFCFSFFAFLFLLFFFCFSFLLFFFAFLFCYFSESSLPFFLLISGKLSAYLCLFQKISPPFPFRQILFRIFEKAYNHQQNNKPNRKGGNNGYRLQVRHGAVVKNQGNGEQNQQNRPKQLHALLRLFPRF